MAGVREFLELLAREAAAVEFEGPLVAARAAGRRPDALAELEQAKLAALRVRALLERRRRREVELSGLFDTASDLAGLRDLDAVLRAIVHRARHLLGTDVAYMTLQRRGARRHLHAGHRRLDLGPFQRLRLPMGAGLGGLVAQTGTPYVTADYADDERFRHTGEIDAGGARGGAGRDPRRAAAAGRERDRRAVRGQPRGPPVRPRGGVAAGVAGRPRRHRHRHRPAAGRDPAGAGRAVAPRTRSSARTATRWSGRPRPTTG